MIDVIENWSTTIFNIKQEVEISVIDDDGTPQFLKIEKGRYIIRKLIAETGEDE